MLGFLLGLAIAASSSPVVRVVRHGARAIGTIWVNAIRMTVIPLVVSLLVSTIVRDRDLGAVGRMGRRALVIFVAMLAVIALIGLLVAPPLLASHSGRPSVGRGAARRRRAASPPKCRRSPRGW